MVKRRLNCCCYSNLGLYGLLLTFLSAAWLIDIECTRLGAILLASLLIWLAIWISVIAAHALRSLRWPMLVGFFILRIQARWWLWNIDTLLVRLDTLFFAWVIHLDFLVFHVPVFFDILKLEVNHVETWFNWRCSIRTDWRTGSILIGLNAMVWVTHIICLALTKLSHERMTIFREILLFGFVVDFDLDVLQVIKHHYKAFINFSIFIKRAYPRGLGLYQLININTAAAEPFYIGRMNFDLLPDWNRDIELRKTSFFRFKFNYTPKLSYKLLCDV